jgi:two-component system NtrC family sensor kinase
LPSRTTRSLPKKTPAPAAIDLLSQLASRVASSTPSESVPAALESLAQAIHARNCVVERIVDGTLVTVAESSVPSAGDDAHVHTRIPIEARGRTVGSLIAHSALPLTNGRRKLLAAAAKVIAPAMIVAELTDRLARDAAERTRGKALENQFTQRVLDSLPLGLHVVDRDYRIRAWNRKRETGLQGVPRDAALGRSIFDVLRRQSETMLRAEFDAVFERGEIIRFDIESGTPDSPRIYRVSRIPMRDGDAVVTHVITIGEDVTDAVRAQEEAAQARKLAAVGTLAAGAMHEINNPLATIGACAETLAYQLEDPSMPESQQASFAELCDIIDHEVHRSKRILNGLLDFSRPTGATRSPAELRDILDQTLRLLKYHPTFKTMQVEVELATDATLVVRADRDQLVQVLMALMLNAMDAMNQSGVIRLRAFQSPVRGEEVVMEVIDAGSGISTAVRQRLFEPFFTTKPPGRGTGLGLSICYGIVADHGGRIEVDSAVGKGSTFRVILPLAEPAA